MTFSVAPTPHSAALTPNDRRTQIQAAIQRYNSACGCEVGSVFMVGATIVFLTYITFGPGSWSAGGSVWRGILWVLSMTVVGKFLGLTYARLRLHVLRAEQRREFSSTLDRYSDDSD